MNAAWEDKKIGTEFFRYRFEQIWIEDTACPVELLCISQDIHRTKGWGAPVIGSWSLEQVRDDRGHVSKVIGQQLRGDVTCLFI